MPAVPLCLQDALCVDVGGKRVRAYADRGGAGACTHTSPSRQIRLAFDWMTAMTAIASRKVASIAVPALPAGV